MTSPELQPIPLLLAEDDDGHADLIERNFRRAGLVNQIIRVHDGQEVIERVHGTGKYLAEGPLKIFLLILDVNMPRLDGVEVLKQLKAKPETASIPVIMLTTTDDPREVHRCYELGCNVYITKPVAYESFVDAIRRLGMFLQVVTLPK